MSVEYRWGVRSQGVGEFYKRLKTVLELFSLQRISQSSIWILIVKLNPCNARCRFCVYLGGW